MTPQLHVRARRHRRRRAGRRPAASSTASTRSCTSPPRATSTARSTGPARSSRPTSSAPTRCSRSCAQAADEAVHFPPRLDRRGVRLARATTGMFTEQTPYDADLALFGLEGRLRPSGARLARAPTACRSRSPTARNNYGPYQFPEKLIPLMILNAARGQAAAGLRRRRQRARLAVRRGSRRGDLGDPDARRSPARPTTSAATPSGPTSTSSSDLIELVAAATGKPRARARSA